MRRTAFLGLLIALGASGYAIAQFAPQIWPADQDGGQNRLYDVASVEIDSATSGGDVCLATPNAILFTPVSPGTNVTITRAAQNGLGGITVASDNQAGFMNIGSSLNRLTMTAQGLDNGGDTFYGATYFGVRADSVASYPGNRDNQQVYFAPQSVYELSSHIDFTSLPGTMPLSPYYFRGETIGIDGTSGNNTRPDGISLGFFWDQPTLAVLHGFTASSYQTGEIFGPPCAGSNCYGLYIYGSIGDVSERVAGTIVSDAMAGSGNRCAEVDSTGKFHPAAAACGGGSVTGITASPPLFSSGGATPNITEQGAIVSGSPSTTAQNIGAIATAPIGCVTSGGVCTVDGLTLSGGLNFNSGTGAETLANMTCGAHTFVSSASTSGGLACTQPAFSDVSGSVTCVQLPALTGDVTTAGGSCATTLANIPNDTPMAGDVLVTAIVAPSTPAAGKGRIYVDSTSKNVCIKNDGGTINHGVQTFTCGSQLFAKALADSGTWTCVQPAFTDLNGSALCGQLPAFTGGITSAGGTCATTLSGSAVAGAATKLHWMVLDNVPAAGRWIVTSSTAFTGVAALEYPNDFLAGHIQTKVDFIASVGAGNFSCFATLNGSGIAGTSLSYTGSLGLQTSTLVTTGSASVNDTYGVECSPAAGGGGTINFSYEVVLTP